MQSGCSKYLFAIPGLGLLLGQASTIIIFNPAINKRKWFANTLVSQNVPKKTTSKYYSYRQKHYKRHQVFTCSIKKSKSIWFSTNHNCDCIVVKNSRYILRWKFVCCVGYQETCFTNGTVTHNNALNCLHCWNSFVSTLNISNLMMTSAPPPGRWQHCAGSPRLPDRGTRLTSARRRRTVGLSAEMGEAGRRKEAERFRAGPELLPLSPQAPGSGRLMRTRQPPRSLVGGCSLDFFLQFSWICNLCYKRSLAKRCPSHVFWSLHLYKVLASRFYREDSGYSNGQWLVRGQATSGMASWLALAFIQFALA